MGLAHPHLKHLLYVGILALEQFAPGRQVAVGEDSARSEEAIGMTLRGEGEEPGAKVGTALQTEEQPCLEHSKAGPSNQSNQPQKSSPPRHNWYAEMYQLCTVSVWLVPSNNESNMAALL